MTELETRLFEALRRLSEQYERERELDAEQVKGLQEQVESLSGLADDLRKQVGNSVAGLQGQVKDSVEGLQGQLAALDGVVSVLATDYKELAADYSRLASEHGRLAADYRRIVNALEKL